MEIISYGQADLDVCLQAGLAADAARGSVVDFRTTKTDI
jgi:hypothetical protein